LLLVADSIAKALDKIKLNPYSYENQLQSFSTYYYFHSKLSRYNGDYKTSFKNLLKRDSVNEIIESHAAETSNQSQYRLVDERQRELKIDLLKSQLQNETLENKFLLLALSASILFILLLLWLWKSRSGLSKRLREQYRIIVRQNKEIELRNKELETIALKLEQGNLEKDRLFTVISHDLRGPSLALKDFFELLVQGHIKQSDFWEMLPNLTNSIETMYRNTDQSLKWSRNQLQGINPKSETINLKKLLRECVSTMQKTASNKNVKLVFSTDITPLEILCDRQHLGIVLRNLLHNAIKFSLENSAIFIDCFVDHSSIPTIVIRDTGIGIPLEVIERLNSSQMIVSQRGTTGEQGTGLGLLICKEYCQANNINLILKPIEHRGTEAILLFKA
jgi:two-component system, sensor histidine kinase and response regulator